MVNLLLLRNTDTMAENNNNNSGDWFDQILSRKLLDVWDLAVCEQVSKDLKKKSNAPALWTEYLERLFRQFDQLVTKIEKYLKPLKQREKDSIQKKKEEEIEKKKKKAKHDLSLKNTEYKAEDTALDYLMNTMGLFKKFSQKERQIIDNYARKEYVLLMVLMIDQLQETLEMVMDIYEEKRQMTDNFEIFDQTLRRYLVQITIMFPLTESKKGSDADVKDHPSVVITDLEARKIWESRIGPKAYCCTFDSFYAKVFEQDYGKECKNKDLVYYLGYFLNFPKDNIVTTYKWHLLTALFGPYPRFMANFKKYVLGKGFGGLINRLQSEDLLKKYPKHIMMRFSRTNPSYMAFSYNVDGYIAHITNNPSWWAKDPFLSIIKKDTSIKKEDAVPIDTFLEELFFEKGFALVPLRIDSSAVKNMLGLKDYASNLNGYLENHPEDSVSEGEHSEEEPEDGGSYQAYERADDVVEEDNVNRSGDMPLRGYSTLGSTAAPMSSSPSRGMYVEALNKSVDSSLNNSVDDHKPRELKGYEDESLDEYLREADIPKANSNDTNNANTNNSVPPPDLRYVGMEDQYVDDKVGRYQDDRFQVAEEAGSGYDNYKDPQEHTAVYDAYEGNEEKSGEDDLVQADELSRLQQQEAQQKQEQAEKEAREQEEARLREEEEARLREEEEARLREEEERLAREKAEQEERDRVAREQAEKEEAERLEKEREAREQAEREKAEQEERDRVAREQAEKEEHERLAKEQAEQERLAREKAEQEERDRLAREQAEREAAEQLQREEQERLAREQAEKQEQERLAREKAEHEAAEKRKREEQERLSREKAEREAAQAKSAVAQKQTTPVTTPLSTPRGPPTDVTPGSFTYEQLVTKPEGADVKKLEAYLSDESFESVFKMKREEFYKLPQWKQLESKKKAKLF